MMTKKTEPPQKKKTLTAFYKGLTDEILPVFGELDDDQGAQQVKQCLKRLFALGLKLEKSWTPVSVQGEIKDGSYAIFGKKDKNNKIINQGYIEYDQNLDRYTLDTKWKIQLAEIYSRYLTELVKGTYLYRACVSTPKASIKESNDMITSLNNSIEYWGNEAAPKSSIEPTQVEDGNNERKTSSSSSTGLDAVIVSNKPVDTQNDDPVQIDVKEEETDFNEILKGACTSGPHQRRAIYLLRSLRLANDNEKKNIVADQQNKQQGEEGVSCGCFSYFSRFLRQMLWFCKPNTAFNRKWEAQDENDNYAQALETLQKKYNRSNR